MKFESKFGLGEIVAYEPHRRDGKPKDELLEVQAITFDINGVPSYLCRYPRTGVTVYFQECQLIGDPDFDQETGYKPEEA